MYKCIMIYVRLHSLMVTPKSDGLLPIQRQVWWSHQSPMVRLLKTHHGKVWWPATPKSDDTRITTFVTSSHDCIIGDVLAGNLKICFGERDKWFKSTLIVRGGLRKQKSAYCVNINIALKYAVIKSMISNFKLGRGKLILKKVITISWLLTSLFWFNSRPYVFCAITIQ